MLLLISLLASGSVFRGLSTPTWCKCPGNVSLAVISPPDIADLGGGLIHSSDEYTLPNMAAADGERNRYYVFAIDTKTFTSSVLVLSTDTGKPLRRVPLPA